MALKHSTFLIKLSSAFFLLQTKMLLVRKDLVEIAGNTTNHHNTSEMYHWGKRQKWEAGVQTVLVGGRHKRVRMKVGRLSTLSLSSRPWTTCSTCGSFWNWFQSSILNTGYRQCSSHQEEKYLGKFSLTVLSSRAQPCSSHVGDPCISMGRSQVREGCC